MNDSKTAARTLRSVALGRDRPLTIERADGHICVTHGVVWLTEPGAARDVFLAAGDGWPLGARPVVLSAERDARVDIVGGKRSGGISTARGWRWLVRAAVRQRRRLQLGPVEAAAWT